MSFWKNTELKVKKYVPKQSFYGQVYLSLHTHTQKCVDSFINIREQILFRLSPFFVLLNPYLHC